MPEALSTGTFGAPIQRYGGTGGIEEEDEQEPEPGDYYSIDDVSNADPRDLVRALENGSVTLDDFEGGELTEAKKLKLIEAAIKESATSAMWDIWASFDDVESVAVEHTDLWTKCLDAGAGLTSLPGIGAIEELFELDVAYVRDLSLIMSRESAETELQDYGLSGDQTGLDPDVHLSRQEAIDRFQAVAAVVAAAVEAQELLRATPIGYEIRTPTEEDLAISDGEADSYDPASAGRAPELEPVLFNPLDTGAEGVEFYEPAEHEWADLKPLHDEAVAVIAYWTERMPALYAVMKDNLDSGQLLDLSEFANQEHTLQTIDRSLREVIAAIDQTEDARLDPLDLIPVHRRLYAGYGQDIGVLGPWHHPFYQSIAKNVVMNHEMGDWWTIIGLGLAGATILVTFAVAGPAGFGAMALLGGVSAGVGVAEAATRFEKAEDLAVAADAKMRDEWSIVEQDQAVAERTKAQLALLFAGLDALGVGPELRSLRAASRAANVSDDLLEAAARAGTRADTGPASAADEVFIDYDKPLSVSGYKSSGAANEAGSRVNVYEGRIPGVAEPVAIKVYEPGRYDVFERDIAGAEAASKTGRAAKFYGEVPAGEGKRAFAMEKVKGGITDNGSTANEASDAWKAAEAEANFYSSKVTKQTIEDVDDYSQQMLDGGNYYSGEVQGLVTEEGRWVAIDFQGVRKLPPESDAEAYAKAMATHRSNFNLEKRSLNKILENNGD